jgi:hypothetical protein
VQPSQERAVVRKEHLWLYLDGDLALSRQSSYIARGTTAVASRGTSK